MCIFYFLSWTIHLPTGPPFWIIMDPLNIRKLSFILKGIPNDYRRNSWHTITYPWYIVMGRNYFSNWTSNTLFNMYSPFIWKYFNTGRYCTINTSRVNKHSSVKININFSHMLQKLYHLFKRCNAVFSLLQFIVSI